MNVIYDIDWNTAWSCPCRANDAAGFEVRIGNIPEAVWHEVVIEGVGQPGADEVKAATWIKYKV